jgi:hypothetical protein
LKLHIVPFVTETHSNIGAGFLTIAVSVPQQVSPEHAVGHSHVVQAQPVVVVVVIIGLNMMVSLPISVIILTLFMGIIAVMVVPFVPQQLVIISLLDIAVARFSFIIGTVVVLGAQHPPEHLQSAPHLHEDNDLFPMHMHDPLLVSVGIMGCMFLEGVLLVVGLVVRVSM